MASPTAERDRLALRTQMASLASLRMAPFAVFLLVSRPRGERRSRRHNSPHRYRAKALANAAPTSGRLTASRLLVDLVNGWTSTGAWVGDERIDAVRAFNRFYTGVAGVLRAGLLDTRFSLTEARVIFELAQHDETEVAVLRSILDLDPGYLSRILARFAADGLVDRERSAVDARRQVVRLTPAGREAYELLDERATEEVARLLGRLREVDQRRMVAAMAVIRDVAQEGPRARTSVLRPLRAGDLGWVVQRHGVLYAEEYGWDDAFEALVARIVADYVDHHEPGRERAWIAERDGEPAGCVFCVRKDRRTAQLRLLLVEPDARGAGIGSRLVEECVRFAEQAGYESLTLWTNDVLKDARRLYERAGFELVASEPHRSFGRDLVGQYWARRL